ncbi:hypothetical protein BJP39_04545 [Streptomyces sp. CC77]|nr:hypothetical protein BJP39_04545 [Streptomyces sp. CC77]
MTQRWARSHPGRRARKTETVPAASTMARFTVTLTTTWTAPRTNPCATVLPASTSMNCGISERYMTAILGLRRLVASPIAKSRRGGSGAASWGAKTDTPPGRRAFHASQAR